MFKEKMQELKVKLKSLFSNKGGDSDGFESNSKNPKSILRKQITKALAVFVGLILILWILTDAVSDAGRTLKDESNNEEQDLTKNNIELADRALDTEIYWRNYFEEDMTKQKVATKHMMDDLKKAQEQMLRDVKSSLTEAVENVQKLSNQQKAKFEFTAKELRAALDEQKTLTENSNGRVKKVAIEEIGFVSDVVFDEPKSAQDYIPEGTYFSGYLLGGIVVSTALNTPDENATPIIIRLQNRGNLDRENPLDVAKCRMTGSAYGDLSSERAVIRLEKMICKEDGVYITSDIAGIVYGDDGFNGIKGTVVSTSSKHLKNAAIGGLISGLSSAAKGQEGVSLGAGGIASTKSKGVGDLLRSGGMSGVSNIGEKLADYYLRQADSMSPVLTIPAGVKVNTQITKGFFVGERGMKNKLKQERKAMGQKGDYR